MERVHLINLAPQIYEHPFDKAALNTLRNLPGFDTVTNFILNWAAVKWNIVAMQGSNFHVTRESCPELYKQIKEDAAVLGVEDLKYTPNGDMLSMVTLQAIKTRRCLC